MAPHDAPLSNPHPSGTDPDGHHYLAVSTHHTSEGRIVYRHCRCGMWRVERVARSGQPVLEAVVAGSLRQRPTSAQPVAAVTTPQAARPPESPVAWVSASGAGA